jgi:hypothetical protein
MQSFFMLIQAVHLVNAGHRRVVMIVHFSICETCQEVLRSKCNAWRKVKASVVIRHKEWGIRVQFLTGTRYFSFVHRTQTGCGVHPAAYIYTAYPELSLEDSSAAVKLIIHPDLVLIGWVCGASPQFLHAFMVQHLIKHRDNFTFEEWRLLGHYAAWLL